MDSGGGGSEAEESQMILLWYAAQIWKGSVCHPEEFGLHDALVSSTTHW